ncbi:MAG: hypothetical protein Q8L78_02700 [Coxiellaceae bacterium]|nr:hypothetical protein [Coxiellaceae bacterium]
MPKKIPEKTDRTKRTEIPFFSKGLPLVKRNPLSTMVPNISTQKNEAISATLKGLTGVEPAQHTVEKTPEGKHFKVGEQGVCGVTASGSKLVLSPSKQLSMTVTSADGTNKESVVLALLVRERDYVPKQKHRLFSSLELSPLSDESSFSVVATPETRESQLPRKKSRKESSAVKNTAKGIVFDYFKKCGVKIPDEEVLKEEWNLCHLLSYGIAMNAKTDNGDTFNTQVFKNIYSGTRVFNENMMRIENVLLQLLNDHHARKITYLALASEFEDSHILATLTLKINIEAINGCVITLTLPFDVSDDRRLSHEASTIFYATIQTLLKTFDEPQADEACKMLF